MVRRVGVVGIATRYALDGQGTNPDGGGEIFRASSRLALSPTQPPVISESGLFLGGKSSRVVALNTHPHLAPRLRKE